MTDEKALFAAICAHPDEDTPRLALADWLEETGTPASVRGWSGCSSGTSRVGEAAETAARLRERFGDGVSV